ncbi:MAG: trehalase family glycosidase [bacterium]
MIKKKQYKKCLEYIENYWESITFKIPDDEGIKIGLPKKFIAPDNQFFDRDMFYWDSYFIILGLACDGKNKIKLMKGIVDNFIYLFDRFNIIPARNRFYDLGHSQPPFLTSMILEVYRFHKNKKWLRDGARIAHLEYDIVWKNQERLINSTGLSHYWDNFYLHQTAEHESGWDMTSRFNNQCLNILPVDLNCCLYKYETDLAQISGLLGDKESKDRWENSAKERKNSINYYMWNAKRKFFFDYDYKKNKRIKMRTLAGFFPMWCGLASEKQAKAMADNLKYFEYEGGLSNTEKFSNNYHLKQWDWPNGFPNLQWIVVAGLLNYGYRADAERVAKKWLELNKRIFDITGKFWEKYDVVHREIGKDGNYLTQSGFAWTNAIFVKMVEELGKK